MERRAIGAESEAGFHEHRSAIVLRDEDGGDVRILAAEEEIEIRLRFAVPAEEENVRLGAGAAEARRHLRQRGRQRLEPGGDIADAFLSRAADENEMFRACEDPLFFNGRKRNRLERATTFAVAFDAFQDRRDVLRVCGRREESNEYRWGQSGHLHSKLSRLQN